MKAFFGIGASAFSDSQFAFYVREYAVVLIAAALCATPIFKNLVEKISASGERQAAIRDCAGWFVNIALFAVSVSFLIMNSYNPFIYFNF